ncbi:MAG: tetratricopeptide repeat protein [Marinoscillum sp.]
MLKSILASFILLIFLAVSAFSQANLDSLANLAKQSTDDSLKVTLYQQLAWNTKFSFPRKSLQYLDTAFAIAREQPSELLLANVVYYQSVVYYLMADYNQAKSKAAEALKYYQTLEYDYGMSSIYNLRGLIHSQQGEYEETLAQYQLSLKLAEGKDDLYAISNPLNNISLVYMNMNDYQNALEYAFKALVIRKEIGDSTYISQSFQHIGNVFYELRELDSAEHYLMSAKKIFISQNNQYSLGLNQSNLGLVYLEQNRYETAITSFKKSIATCAATENLEGVFNATNNLSIAYAAAGQYLQADMFADSALNLARKYKSLPNLEEALVSKTQALEGLENYSDAFYYSKQLLTISDSLINEEKAKKISELETRFQTAQKEQEIANQQLEIAEKEADIQSKKIQIGGLLGGLAIVILFGFIFYNQYRAKQNAKLQLAILSEKERGFESVIQATEEERKRISKDLHDGIGQQLSALKMALSNLAGKTSDENQREDLELITEQFSNSAEEVRQVSHQMMPRTLMDFGLINAIEDLLQNSFKFSDIKYEFEHRLKDQRFAERIEISLYRILQELINNVIKHSEANELSVQLIQNTGKLLLFIEDNGKGMNNNNSGGHGLLNIKSRLDMIKGSINYEPGPSRGTSATISIPVE